MSRSTVSTPELPAGMHVLERGWLSANSVIFSALPGDAQGSAVVDTGYVSHATQTLDLLERVLQGQPLARILNTHLHSDHCGGNATLQKHWPAVQTWIAPGQAALVRDWDPVALGYMPTGQSCPQFAFDAVLTPGQTIQLSGQDWQIHAAPGHDPHAVVLFDPRSRVLISGDALWENGFGVVFPEIEGIAAFDQVGATLEVIAQLQPAVVVPGHGGAFTDVGAALVLAQSRLQSFVQSPERHARYAAKVLIKYKLLEWQSVA